MSKRRANIRMRRQRRWQWTAAAAAGLLVLAVAAGLYFSRTSNAGTHTLVGGAIVAKPQPAPDFALNDQFGQPQTLSGFRGKPVALTFIYTNCPDVCPLISAHMHQAYQALGAQAGQVGMVAVTVDPERDTQQRILTFSDAIGLTKEWHFLTGSRPQLAAVWNAYGIASQKAQTTAATAGQASPADAEADLIEHSAPVFLIDKHGQVRAMLPVDVSAEDIATDLRVLLAEQG